MSSKWILGVHFDKAEGEEGFICKRCGKKIAGASGLGPHLAACFGKEPTAPTPLQPSEKVEEFGLDEKQNLVDTLKQFGIKYSEGLASFMEAYGFEDLNMLDECLRLAQVDPGKRKLIVSRWSHHIQKPIPPTLLQKWNQPIEIQPPQAFPNQQSLSREELERILEERERAREEKERLARLEAEIETLKRGNIENPKSEVQQLREELAKLRQDEVLRRLERIGQQVAPAMNVYGVISQSLKTIEQLVETSPLRYYLATGSPYPPQQKEIESGARESIFQKLSEKYVVESD